MVNCHTHCGAKYEKFAYSNLFGFSVPKSEWGTGPAGLDSTLGLSECDNVYRVKRENKEFKVTDEYIYTRWTPWNDVEIKTYIIPALPWHVRVHLITSARELDSFEGGFAYPSEHVTNTEKTDNSAFAEFDGYKSGIVGLIGERRANLHGMEANTNLMYSRTSLPALTGRINKGETVLACAVFCGEGGESLVPTAFVEDGKIKVTIMNKEIEIKI